MSDPALRRARAVARRAAPAPRHDGFTPERQRHFLETLAATASVADAAKAAGVSRTTAYRRRAEPDADAFRLGWAAAVAHGFDRLVDTAFERAVNGVEHPILHQGETVGTRTVHNDRLLMFLLRRRSDFVPTSARYVGNALHTRELYGSRDFAAMLDLIAPARGSADAGATDVTEGSCVSTSSLSHDGERGDRALPPPRATAEAEPD